MAQGRLIALGSIQELRTGLGGAGGADMETLFMAYLERSAAGAGA